MSGPANINPRQTAMGSLDELMNRLGTRGWDDLENPATPVPPGRGFEPEEKIKRYLASSYETELGRALVDWLLDLTCRAPYPFTHPTAEILAFSAARHQGRALIGEAIVKAVAEGRALNSKEPNR